MLRSCIIAIALALASSSTAFADDGDRRSLGSAQCVGKGQLEAHVRRELQLLVDTHDYPGFAFAVYGPAGPIIEGGVGHLNRNGSARMTERTIFQIGSITKTFTGALLAKLATEEKLNLGDRLSDHWFEGDVLAIDTDDHPVTLQAIATHTAGLPRYPQNLDREDGDPILGYSITQMREALVGLARPNEPSVKWAYSNYGYGVLANAIAISQGKSFERLLHEEILKPLELDDTMFNLSGEARSRLATPYRDDNKSVATQPWNMEAMSAAGGLFSSVRDLARFGIWLQSDNHKSAESRLLQRAPLVRQTATRAYGLGVFVVDDYVDNVDVIWHGGDVDGYAGALVILPDHGIAFAYMTNIGFANGFADFQRGLIGRSAELCGDLGGHL